MPLLCLHAEVVPAKVLGCPRPYLFCHASSVLGDNGSKRRRSALLAGWQGRGDGVRAYCPPCGAQLRLPFADLPPTWCACLPHRRPHHKRVAINLTALLGPLTSMVRGLARQPPQLSLSRGIAVSPPRLTIPRPPFVARREVCEGLPSHRGTSLSNIWKHRFVQSLLSSSPLFLVQFEQSTNEVNYFLYVREESIGVLCPVGVR